ncbi:RNA polymerase sigma factor [bacterium]|nr:RNA polymerase sigma factor [bacterium]
MSPEEFRKIILPEGRRLYALAFRYLNNREEAEDMVQEVMMKLWTGRNEQSHYASPAAWCTTVTRNSCIDMLRRRKRIRAEEISDAILMPETDPGLSHSTENREAVQLISTIVSRMKEPYRSAVILRDMEGYSYEETAEIMQTNIINLRTVLSRARKSIREEMERIYNYGTGQNRRTAQ